MLVCRLQMEMIGSCEGVFGISRWLVTNSLEMTTLAGYYECLSCVELVHRETAGQQHLQMTFRPRGNTVCADFIGCHRSSFSTKKTHSRVKN